MKTRSLGGWLAVSGYGAALAILALGILRLGRPIRSGCAAVAATD
ncbi:hypothetical protein [Rhodospirillum rubrum]|nr:hypothetical protein [Rhodospirillum rubrum]